jgi:hypothetical protein
VSADEYHLFSAFIDLFYGPEETHLHLSVLLIDSTLPGFGRRGLLSKRAIKEMSARLPDFDVKTLVNRFVVINQTRALISSNELANSVIHTFMHQSVFDSLFHDCSYRDVDWDKFYGRFPGTYGYLGLTRPAFNDSRTRALPWYNWSGAVLYGSGGFAFLRKVGSKWFLASIEGGYVE